MARIAIRDTARDDVKRWVAALKDISDNAADAFRIARGDVSLEEFASLLRVSPAFLRSIESKTIEPSITLMGRLLETLR